MRQKANAEPWSFHMARTGHWLRPRAFNLGAVCFVLLSSCSGSAPATGSAVDITIRDFSISAPSSILGGGNTTLSVANNGPSTHEFVIVRTDLPADQLPIGADGLSADEEQLDVIGEIGEVDLWTTQTISLPLPPGRYVFFCNLEGHYLGGMHATLVVT
jgi:hypothetical protein